MEKSAARNLIASPLFEPMHAVELLQFGTDQDLATRAANDWVARVRQHDPAKPYTVALSGGRIAKSFFTAVTQAAKTLPVDWSAVHWFWADERCVPADHPESNFATASALLLRPLGIAPERIHRLEGERPPTEGAAHAERDLLQLLPSRQGATPKLDLVILGMGEDGHVASLFPGDEVEKTRPGGIFRAVVASKPPPNRITLSYAMLRAASDVWVLASGAGKEQALSASLLTGQTPFGQVRESRESLRIYTDICS